VLLSISFDSTTARSSVNRYALGVQAVREGATIDGRRARRERNRSAVIDAMFSLLGEDGSPAVEAIAATAGVSVSSVFRYFDNLDDLLRETVSRYFERYEALFEIPAIGEGDLPSRIDRFVAARSELYETTAPIARVARRRAPEHARIGETLDGVRRTLSAQARRHFAPELTARRGAEADDIIALVDSMTSFEAWDLLRTAHGRSPHQIRRAWARGVDALVRQ
jgi:AcrR family transcriptional regulator